MDGQWDDPPPCQVGVKGACRAEGGGQQGSGGPPRLHPHVGSCISRPPPGHTLLEGSQQRECSQIKRASLWFASFSLQYKTALTLGYGTTGKKCLRRRWEENTGKGRGGKNCSWLTLGVSEGLW